MAKTKKDSNARKHVTLALTEEEHTLLRELADDEDRPMSRQVMHMTRRRIKERSSRR